MLMETNATKQKEIEKEKQKTIELLNNNYYGVETLKDIQEYITLSQNDID